VRREDIIAFATRDWDAIAEHKRRYWTDQALTADEKLRIADELRRYAYELHPDWPTAEQREEDLATHVRVGEALRRVRRPDRH
jgi:hypothetical protein